jgi:putative MATE family efflux protein
VPARPAGGSRPGAPVAGVFALAWPMMALFGLQALVGVVDLIFVSSLGPGAVAAVGVAMQLQFFSLAALMAVSAGTVAVVAREWGRGDADEAARATRCSVALSAAFGALLMLAIPWSEEIVSLLGVDADVAALGGRCLRILLLWGVPLAVGMTLSTSLRAVGDVRTPLAIGIAANAVNLVGCYALVFGRLGAPALGAEGSAWASGIAFVFAAALALGLWLRGRLRLPPGRWRGSVTRLLSWRLLRVGLPAAAEQASFNAGLLLFMSLVSGFGTEPLSAYLIGVRILSFCFVPGFGFSLAISTLVGQNLGAGQPDQAARAGWRGVVGCVAVMGTLGLAIVSQAGPLAALFGAAGDETTALAVTFIHILGAAQPLMAMEFSLGGGLRGAGDTRFPLVAMLTGLFVFRLGGALLVARPLFGTVVAVWCCLLADYAVKAALLWIRFAAGRWKEIDV